MEIELIVVKIIFVIISFYNLFLTFYYLVDQNSYEFIYLCLSNFIILSTNLITNKIKIKTQIFLQFLWAIFIIIVIILWFSNPLIMIIPNMSSISLSLIIGVNYLFRKYTRHYRLNFTRV